jgi:hypothetical protein
MRTGKHFVEITVLKRVDGLAFGVIRPQFDVKLGGENAYDRDGHCFYDTRAGYGYQGCYPYRWYDQIFVSLSWHFLAQFGHFSRQGLSGC